MKAKNLQELLDEIECNLKKLTRVQQEKYFIKKIKAYGRGFTDDLSNIGTHSQYPLTMQFIEELGGYASVDGDYIPLTIHQDFISKSRKTLRAALDETDVDKIKALLIDLYGDANGCKLD